MKFWEMVCIQYKIKCLAAGVKPGMVIDSIYDNAIFENDNAILTFCISLIGYF